MAKNSKIHWTHHTFNPWWGCTKISDACKNCYAEAWSKRTGASIWGAKALRRFFGEEHWHEPIRWNAEAQRLRKRMRVFSASMGDVLEKRTDLEKSRVRLWEIIQCTPWLDWLLLTKRPENISNMVPWDDWPTNVWIGTTAENQETAEKRIPFLLMHPAIVRFVSCEPLLGPIDLSKWLKHTSGHNQKKIDWVIVGGESGHSARPMHPLWVYNLRDQCVSVKVPFYFKQWGCWRPSETVVSPNNGVLVFAFPNVEPIALVRKGRKEAGRDLDGRFWNEIPQKNGGGRGPLRSLRD